MFDGGLTITRQIQVVLVGYIVWFLVIPKHHVQLEVKTSVTALINSIRRFCHN